MPILPMPMRLPVLCMPIHLPILLPMPMCLPVLCMPIHLPVLRMPMCLPVLPMPMRLPTAAVRARNVPLCEEVWSVECQVRSDEYEVLVSSVKRCGVWSAK